MREYATDDAPATRILHVVAALREHAGDTAGVLGALALELEDIARTLAPEVKGDCATDRHGATGPVAPQPETRETGKTAPESENSGLAT